MGTVYITQEDAFIGKLDERLTVKADKKNLLDVPLIKIDGVVALGRALFRLLWLWNFWNVTFL
jgi:Uncharacterized protein predicted to be involved in DNA repair